MKKDLIYYIIMAISVLPLFSSCSSKHELTPIVAYDSISVSIDYPFIGNYSTLVPCVRNGNPYACGYNHQTHSLDMLSLSGKGNESLPLEREGADGVLPSGTFCFLPGGIVWRDHRGIAVLSWEGKVTQRYPADALRGGDPSVSYSLTPKGVLSGEYMLMSGCDDEVAVSLSPLDGAKDARIGKLYHVSNNEADFLPMTYPSDVAERMDGMGDLSLPYIMPYGDRIVYGFPYSSKVYVYDRSRKECQELDKLMSQATENTVSTGAAKGADSKSVFEFARKSVRYRETYYSAALHKYFRVHYGEKSSLFDKHRQKYLIVYNEKNGRTTEYVLPESFTEQYVMCGDTMYIVLQSGLNTDEVYNFAVLDLNDLGN